MPNTLSQRTVWKSPAVRADPHKDASKDAPHSEQGAAHSKEADTVRIFLVMIHLVIIARFISGATSECNTGTPSWGHAFNGARILP